jgi:hypothetical protein
MCREESHVKGEKESERRKLYDRAKSGGKKASKQALKD